MRWVWGQCVDGINGNKVLGQPTSTQLPQQVLIVQLLERPAGMGGGGLGWKVLHHTYGAYHCQARWRCVTVTVAGLVDGGGGGYSFISLCKFPLQPKLHFTEVPDYILV